MGVHRSYEEWWRLQADAWMQRRGYALGDIIEALEAEVPDAPPGLEWAPGRFHGEYQLVRARPVVDEVVERPQPLSLMAMAQSYTWPLLQGDRMLARPLQSITDEPEAEPAALPGQPAGQPEEEDLLQPDVDRAELVAWLEARAARLANDGHAADPVNAEDDGLAFEIDPENPWAHLL